MKAKVVRNFQASRLFLVRDQKLNSQNVFFFVMTDDWETITERIVEADCLDG